MTTMTPQSTQKLVQRARAGERGAFDELVEQYQDRLAAAVRARLGTALRRKVDVEDVLQETFLKAFASLDSFEDRSPDAFFHWLKGIAENLLLYWARQLTQRDQLRLDKDLGRSTVSPSNKLRREERFERLQQSIDSLSPEHREVILLARVEGLTAKEIAGRMDRSTQAVKGLLWRALQNLRGAFGEDTRSLNLRQRTLAELPPEERSGADGK